MFYNLQDLNLGKDNNIWDLTELEFFDCFEILFSEGWNTYKFLLLEHNQEINF